MLFKDNQHDRPLYYTRYIGSACIERIQVGSGFTLSITPRRLLHFLGIPLSKLSTMTTTIYGFHAGNSYPLGKICLRCQIRDQKAEVTCYVIDADMSYNLLLRRSWIHANWIVPFTLHQCLKYVDDKAMVRTVFAEIQPFKGVKKYFTDFLLYQEVNKVTKKPLLDNIDSANEVNSESEEDMPSTLSWSQL